MEAPIPAAPLIAFMTLKTPPLVPPSLNWNNYIRLYGALYDLKVLNAKLVCMVVSRNHQNWQ